MDTRRLAAVALAWPFLLSSALAQGPRPLPVLDDKPTPQVDAGGPSAAVMALAFSADGQTLYGAGLDKVVRVWARERGRFVLKQTYRVPLGPGNAGGLNAVALSPDGAWLAMAGRAPMRGEAGFRQGGVVVEAGALSAELYRDAGLIYVASTANPAGGKVLRGHRGEVRALAFAPARPGKPPLLVSAATERDGDRHFGGLRLWDVSSGKLLARRDNLPATVTRPGLAVWHSGPGAADVRVAVAWPEVEASKPGYLRLWDAGRGADDPRRGWEADAHTRTAALLGQADGGATVLTGGYAAPAGRLQRWTFSGGGDVRAGVGDVATFGPDGATQFLPVSLAAVSARHAAVLLQPSADADFRLALVDLRARRVVAEVPLEGSDRRQLPTVAARGEYLAVAATADHAVRVYAVADLLAGKPEPRQALAGAGLAPRRVAFVAEGRGLWLSTDRQARRLQGGLVFDLDKRQVRANDRAGLAADAPDPGEWSVRFDEKVVRVRQGEKALPEVRLSGKDQVVTAVALRPGRPGVLAVAYTEREAARTLIMLCDPATGKPYRLLVGHLQDVRALAFSARRPLLASVADDQTVCVWGLADLDRPVGRVAGLRGVHDEGKKVVVSVVEPGSAAAKELAAGDVLEKVGAPAGPAKPVKDAADFLLAVAARKPGDQVELTVAGKGVVKLPVERGVDERKPLFSLLLLRTGRLPEWVGWSPAGPYDCSGPAAERHLGWHTNTGDPAAPVSFAAAGEYRKDYYRAGILGYLAAEADLGRALRKWDADHPDPPPRPALRPVRPDEALQGERANEYPVRQAVKALRVGINDDYPLDDKHVLRWRLTRADGGKVKGDDVAASGVAARDGKGWRADLAGVEWRRGEYRLVLALRPAADRQELTSEAVTLRFQPPPPVLALRPGGKAVATTEQKPLQVTEARLDLEVALEAAPGQEVEVRFGHYRNGVPQQDAPAPKAVAWAFQQSFTLQEGLHRLTVRAVNKGALAGHEDEEAAPPAEVWVSYKPKPEPLPRLSARLDPAPEVKEREGKEVWVVSRPTVRLTGKVEAEGTLTLADWSVGDGARKSWLPARPGRKADFSAELGLKLGEEVLVRLRAKSERSAVSTAEHRVVFHPLLPDVTLDALDGTDFLTEKVTLTGTAGPTAGPFRLLFRVSSPEGKVKEFPAEVGLAGGKWKAELTLFPGVNSVETVVANEWRGRRTAEGSLQLRYRRPPRITAAPEKVEAVETNKVPLALTVEGPTGRPLRAVTVDQAPVRFEAGKPETKGERWVWQVRLPEVFVHDGDRNLDRVALRAVTDEGASAPAVVRVEHKMRPRPPAARFLSPVAPDTARRPEYTATIRVESERPLERVQILRGREVLYEADLKKVEREGGRFVLQADAPLRLTKGPNTLELVAVNRDGRSPRAEAVVSWTEPAVLVDIDRVELRNDKGEVEGELRPRRSGGAVTFPQPAPRSLVWLAGRVRWSDPQAKALDDRALQVVVKVGDCRQFPVALGPRGRGDEANVRPFHVPLFLIGANNQIKVEVPSVGQQEQSRREFKLACAAPAGKQRLHVLIVGVDARDAAALKRRVLDALAADPQSRPRGLQGTFAKNPPFEQCILYHVLVGEVTRGQVEGQLVEVYNEIDRLRGETHWLNDVVLVYYQGKDYRPPGRKERWLLTSGNYRDPKAPPQEYAIPCHRLPRLPGAQLLLLNVAGSPGPRAAGPDWGGDPDVGLMRYAFNDPAATAAEADPALLGLLQEAIRQKGRLGEVVEYVREQLAQKHLKWTPLVVLDDDQKSRRLGEPGR